MTTIPWIANKNNMKYDYELMSPQYHDLLTIRTYSTKVHEYNQPVISLWGPIMVVNDSWYSLIKYGSVPRSQLALLHKPSELLGTSKLANKQRTKIVHFISGFSHNLLNPKFSLLRVIYVSAPFYLLYYII